jgi:hypothetical protein
MTLLCIPSIKRVFRGLASQFTGYFGHLRLLTPPKAIAVDATAKLARW